MKFPQLLAISLIISAYFFTWAMEGQGNSGTPIRQTGSNDNTFDDVPVCEEGGDGTLEFIENTGQLSRDDIIYFTTGRTSVGFTGNSFVHVLSDIENRAYSFEIEFHDCNIVEPVAGGRTDTIYNFYHGDETDRWAAGLNGYITLEYPDIWDGVDMLFYSINGDLKYDLVLSPGADINDIRFDVIGASYGISDDGRTLTFTTPLGDVTDTGLIAYQDTGEVEIEFRMEGPASYSFEPEDYNDKEALVIDPLVSACTYLGGTSYEESPGEIIVYNGDHFVSGMTNSLDFPVTSGVIDSTIAGQDVFLSRMSGDLSTLKASTFIGGSNPDHIGGMDIDDLGNVYLAGFTYSKDFPTTQGVINETSRIWTNETEWGWQETYCDTFVSKLSPNGDNLIYSTFYTGKEYDYCVDVAVDDDGEATITGYTESRDLAMVNSYDDEMTGYYDLFVMKLDSSASSIVYSTYIGGNDWGGESVSDIELDGSGRAVICGYTEASDFPTTNGAYRTTFGSSWSEGYLLKLGLNGDTLEFSTYVFENTQPMAMEITPDSVVLTGYTYSSTLPVTDDAYQKQFGSSRDSGFLMEFAGTGSSLDYCSYFGGSGTDSGYDVIVDENGQVMIGGYTSSGDLPTTAGVPFPDLGGDLDGFLARFTPDKKNVDFLTYFGGSSDDILLGLHSLDSNNIALYLWTSSSDLPVSSNAYDRKLGQVDMALATIKINSYPPLPPMNLTVERGDENLTLSWDPPLHDGNETLTNYSVYMSVLNRSFEKVVTLDVGIDSFRHEYLTNGEDYYYYITASNIVGESPRSRIVAGIPARPPSMPVITSVETGDSRVILNWEDPEDLGGDLDITFNVYFGTDSQSLEIIRSGLTDFTFTRGNLTNGVRYFFALSASNSVGEGTLTSPIPAVPMKKPSEVVNLTYQRGSRFVHVFWEPPIDDGGSDSLEYDVMMKKRMSDAPFERIASDLDILHYNATGLSNGVTYDFVIMVSNEKGEGPSSLMMSATPLGIPTQPRDISLSMADGKAELTWAEPTDLGGAVSVTYSVYMAEDGSNLNLLASGIEGREYRLSGLTNGAEYEFRITASNDIHEGPLSSSVRGVPVGPPGAPGNLDLAIRDSGASLTWTAPDHMGGDVSVKYRVFMGLSRDEMSEAAETTTPSVSIEDLENGKVHYFGVKAFNSYGPGPISEIVSGIPLTTPGIPRILFSENRNGSIHITWSPPIDDGGSTWLTYNIHVKPDGGSLGLFEENISSTNYLLEGLEPGIEYSIGVTAVGAGGEGLISDTVRITPIASPPDPFTVSISEKDDMIIISWEIPERTGGSQFSDILVYRSVEGGAMEVIATLSPQSTSFEDRTVEVGVEYSYVIRGRTEGGLTPSSNTVSGSVISTEDDGIEMSVIIIPLAAVMVIAVIVILFLGLRSSGPPVQQPVYQPEATVQGTLNLPPEQPNGDLTQAPDREVLPSAGVNDPQYQYQQGSQDVLNGPGHY